MENKELLDSRYDIIVSKTFISNVFAYMFLGLSITAVTSWWFASSGLVFNLINPETGSFNALGYIIMFAPLGVSLLMQSAYQKFSKITLLAMFVGYAAVLGMSLSFIFLIYTAQSLVVTFGITAATFGGMALLGYTTKTDLTQFGSILIMAFWGVFIASIVNMLIGSEMLDYIISIIGVLVFTGLTAYFMQNIKKYASDPNLEGETKSKLEIIFGLQLYILFVNLFMTLLRFFGSRD